MEGNSVDCAAPNCGEAIESDYAEYSNVLESQVCSGCYQSDLDHITTAITFDPEHGESKTYVGDLVVMGEYGDHEDPKAFHRVWKQTDGWRGHYTTTMTGDWREVSEDLLLWGERTEGSDLGEAVKRACDDGTLPVQVVAIVDPTSNVFASGISFFVRNSDAAAFSEWSATI